MCIVVPVCVVGQQQPPVVRTGRAAVCVVHACKLAPAPTSAGPGQQLSIHAVHLWLVVLLGLGQVAQH